MTDNRLFTYKFLWLIKKNVLPLQSENYYPYNVNISLSVF